MSTIKNMFSLVRRTLKIGVKTFVAAHLVNEYIGGIALIRGPSMEPTLSNFNIVYVDRLIVSFQGIKTGDIIICPSIYNPNSTICSRVGAVAGQLIFFRKRIFQIPPGYIWVEGDNDQNYMDSRKFGPVPLGLVRGRVLCSIYPKFKILSSQFPDQ